LSEPAAAVMVTISAAATDCIAGHHHLIGMSERHAQRSKAVPTAWLAVSLGLAYLAADIVLNKLALGDGWQIFWPLNGITIATLVMRRREDWALLLLAISAGTGVGEYFDGNSLTSTLVQRALSMLEVLLSAAFLPRFFSLSSWLRIPGLYLRFGAAVCLGPAVSGLLAASYFQVADAAPFLAGFNSWALSDAMGIAATLPLVLALFSVETRAMHGARQWLKCGATLAVALTTMGVIFVTSRYPLIFVLYPLLMLVDWMLGLLGSSIALCGACILAVFLTEHGYGPFANITSLGVSQQVAVQLYLGFHLIGFLPISILFVQQRRMEQELREALVSTAALASLDGLTSVANRRAWDRYLEEQWELGARARTPLAMLMIDADHFKDFNDQFGHQAGDECLRTLAATLKKQVTRPADLVARFGGEEFAILLPDTPLEGAQRVAESVRKAIFELAIARGESSGTAAPEATAALERMTVSIGCCAQIPATGGDFRQLVELSDRALYLAKRTGRNRVCSATPDDDVWYPGAAAKKLKARIEAYRLSRSVPPS
jgi:diguanylate cyclase (GGDEF)-like protein